MKILITGGAGFIGSNIANYYLNQGKNVIIYDNLSRKGVENNLKWLKNKHQQLKFIKSDIRDFNSLKKWTKDCSIIFHMASQVAVTASVVNPKEDFEINALGTLNVLEAARTQSKPPIIIYASTNKVYGGMEGISFKEKKTRYEFKEKELKKGISEKFSLDFHSPYGCSKGAGDQYAHDYSRIYGLKTLVFRQSCIYGKRQFGNEDQGWVAHFIIRALNNKQIAIFGDGKQVRDLLYIDDLINCFEKALKNIDKTKGNIYNVGGGLENAVSLLELINLIEKKSGKAVKLKFNKWRPGDQKVYISNNQKAYNDFNWKPKTSVNQGVDKLFQWLRSIH